MIFLFLILINIHSKDILLILDSHLQFDYLVNSLLLVVDLSFLSTNQILFQEIVLW